MTQPIPTPEDQVQFLRNFQRLLDEGLFVASYKFALLHALVDLAVLKGEDSGGPLELNTREIAARFVELYWRQSRPFQVAGQTTNFILKYSSGKQAAIISEIIDSQQSHGGSLFRFRQLAPDSWSQLVVDVDQVVRKMPLWKLQTVGKERLDFLYTNADHGKSITLKPGVMYCLRSFYSLLRDLIQGAWVRFVQKLNADKLGNITDLATFLFGQERSNLDAYRPILMDVQQGNCLYCGKELPKQSQVDHFIPWSRYPVDLGENYVLAHVKCNSAKSDYVAAERHLHKWSERNSVHRQQLQQRFQQVALPCDLRATIQISTWIYEQTEKANGQVWVAEKTLEHLTHDWRKCLLA